MLLQIFFCLSPQLQFIYVHTKYTIIFVEDLHGITLYLDDIATLRKHDTASWRKHDTRKFRLVTITFIFSVSSP